MDKRGFIAIGDCHEYGTLTRDCSMIKPYGACFHSFQCDWRSEMKSIEDLDGNEFCSGFRNKDIDGECDG